MKDLFPRKPFHEREEFYGSLSKGGKSIDELQIVLQHSLLHGDNPEAKIFGNSQTYKKLIEISNESGAYWELRSHSHEDERRTIKSDRVIVKLITKDVWPKEYGDKFVFKVMDIEFLELTISWSIENDKSRERHLTYFLSGPTDLWHITPIREQSFTGEIRHEVKNTRIELEETSPIEIEIRPHYFYENSNVLRGNKFTDAYNDMQKIIDYELMAKSYTLNLTTKKNESQLSNEEFVKLGEKIVDDILILMSFISNNWITWRMYYMVTGDEMITYLRGSRQGINVRITPEDSLVDYGASREFLQTGFSKYRELRNNNFNLFLPIVYFLSANDTTFLEQEFTNLFLSLEKIKDIYASDKKMDKIISKSKFSKIRKQIEPFLETDQMKEKIPELNRTTIKFILDDILDSLNLTFEDLYPIGEEFTLINTRNNLIHGVKELDMDLLFKEVVRLRGLVGRIILGFLGWKDISNSPHAYMLRFISQDRRN